MTAEGNVIPLPMKKPSRAEARLAGCDFGKARLSHGDEVASVSERVRGSACMSALPDGFPSPKPSL
jgi:hypothetical protein